MEASFLLPREKYDEVAKTKGKLPTLEIEKNNHVLFFFGANHSRDPHNEQYPKLREYWRVFLEKTQKKNCVVLVEGRLRPLDENENEAITSGSEGSLMTLWAHQENIQVACPEPNRDEMDAVLQKNFPDELISLYGFLGWINNWQHYAEPKPDFERQTRHWLSDTYWPWNSRSRLDVDGYKRLYTKITGRNFDPEDTRINDFINPNRTDTEINKVARISSDIRDLHIASEIEKYWEEGKNVFVVFGKGHLIIEEPALKKVLSSAAAGTISSDEQDFLE